MDEDKGLMDREMDSCTVEQSLQVWHIMGCMRYLVMSMMNDNKLLLANSTTSQILHRATTLHKQIVR